MNTTKFENGIAVNRDAYEELREGIRQQHSGQYVAMAGRKIVATAPSYDEALRAVQRLRPVPNCYFIFEADEEPIFDVVTDYFGRY